MVSNTALIGPVAAVAEVARACTAMNPTTGQDQQEHALIYSTNPVSGHTQVSKLSSRS